MDGYVPDPNAGAPLTTRTEYIKRWNTLKTQRATWDAPWREIGEYVQPRRVRFFSWDRESAGTKKNFNIINSNPTRAVEVNAAGMHAGISSPTRPWFRLTTTDKTLSESDGVKTWLGATEDRMYRVFAGSNIYLKLHELYLDLGPFCTSVIHIEEDTKAVIRAYVFPIGSYALAASSKGFVDVCYRQLQMTVQQIYDEFVRNPDTGKEDWSVASPRVKNAYEQKRRDEWIDVLHVLEPNDKLIHGRMGAKGMAYRSCWLEVGTADNHDKLLREAGFQEKPFAAARWSTIGEDVYGSGPGMTAIGDCKTLQILEREALRITERLADPPMVGPVSMRDNPIDLDPGGISYEDPTSSGKGFRPAQDLPPGGLQAVEAAITRVDERIRRVFMEDLWLMIAQDDAEGGRMTATEVNERKSEKMLQLGPMLERFQDEVLNFIIERTYATMLRRGLVPPPPQELQGADIKVEYVSILAQAQKAAGLQGLKELSDYAVGLAAANPDALDNIDEDAMISEYADLLGTPPEMLRPKDEVAARRAARQKAQQQQSQMQAAQVAAGTAKTMGDTNTQDDNALTRVMAANGLAQ